MGETLIRPASTAASGTTPTDTVGEIVPVGGFSGRLKLLEREADDKSPARIGGLQLPTISIPRKNHNGPAFGIKMISGPGHDRWLLKAARQVEAIVKSTIETSPADQKTGVSLSGRKQPAAVK